MTDTNEFDAIAVAERAKEQVAEIDSKIEALRQARSDASAQIKALGTERAKLTRIASALTPRTYTRKPKAVAAAAPAGASVN